MLEYSKVYQSYVIDGLSDREIALKYGVDRTTVVRFRQKHSIPSRVYLGEIGEGIVTQELQRRGLVVMNMNKRSKLHPYDLLIHGHIRVDVKTARPYKNHWCFALSQKAETGVIESDRYIRLANGRLRKQFHRVCDFLILCGIREDKPYLFVVPTHVIDQTLQNISIPLSGRGKWWVWHNRFDLIEKGVRKDYIQNTTPF